MFLKMFWAIGFFFLLFLIVAALCIAERDGSEEEKDYKLTLDRFARFRKELWTEWSAAITNRRDRNHRSKNHSHSPKTYDELYTTRKEDHYENN